MNNLRKAMRQYIKEKAALGFKTYTPNLCLHQFIDFLEDQHSPFITQKLALQWATLPDSSYPSYWAARLSVIRQFAKYYIAIDPRTEIPAQGLISNKYQRMTPYIYTEKQIIMLISASRKIPSETGLRALTYATFFGLMAVTGVRISEIIALDRTEVDLKEGILLLRKTKHERNRLIPMHSTTTQKLVQYIRYRDRVYPKTKTQSFFVSESGMRLTACTVRWTFNKLSRQIGLRGPSDRVGPRIHDLRHTFAVKMVQDWYRQGENVDKLMPQLTLFLGHRHLKDTYWYVTATPELLQLAAKRADYFKERVE